MRSLIDILDFSVEEINGLVETAIDEKEIVIRILIEEMQGAANLMVPLMADVHSGNNWYEAK